MAVQLDHLTRIVNVHWGSVGCRFAVCGYAGNGVPPEPIVFFGVGAYSDNGKTWTTFRNFENGGMHSIFHLRHPDKTQTTLVAGGSINGQVGDANFSTATLKTIFGLGPNAGGGISPGILYARYTSLGYNKSKNLLYAVEYSGENAATATLHTFPLGLSSEIPSTPSGSKDSIFWVGPRYPGIGPVYDCSCSSVGPTNEASAMTFKDKEGKAHTLTYNFAVFPHRLLLDGVDITPFGSRGIFSAAGGTNDAGDMIIVAVGYHLIDTDDHAIAWWSLGGTGWTEISGIWSGVPAHKASMMACAVPNP